MSSESHALAELKAIRRRERHAAAVARTAARVASERSLPATLRALAHEILQADGLAGVQVLTNEYSRDKLRMLGIAGFPTSPSNTFFSLLMECQRRGADLRTLDVLHTGEPVIIPHRYEEVMNNPAWEPLHEYHRHPKWDAFAAIPIKARQSTIGILNVFVSPGKEIDQEGYEFLIAMAEQAGLAIDYASLLEEERNAAQRMERQRLARDLHDSVVQQVFSMGMLAQTLKVLSDGNRPDNLTRIREITTDLEDITGSVLQDLRGLVAQLRPSAITGVGLKEALAKLEATTHRQTGVKFDMSIGEVSEEIEGDFAEDVYHVIAEAVHNAIKHSSAGLVTVSLDLDDQDTIQLCVRDNGRDPGGPEDEGKQDVREGNGLSFMHQRVERWGGELTVNRDSSGTGTVVRAEIPHRTLRPDGPQETRGKLS